MASATNGAGLNARPTGGCQIEVTNVCNKSCAYCSRLTRHYRRDQRYFMSLHQIEEALDSLDGFSGLIGVTGGEPTLHPDFPDVCRLLQTRHPRSRFGLWTSGGRPFQKHSELIEDTFGYVHINEHNELQLFASLHQPLSIAVRDVVEDEGLRELLIDQCWVTREWGPSIGPKGVFFCEVAHAWDQLLDGPGGFPVEPGWWTRGVAERREQVQRYCGFCGMAIPMKGEPQGQKKQKFSPGNLDLFRQRGLACVSDEDVEICDWKLDEHEIEAARTGWYPSEFRRFDPERELQYWITRSKMMFLEGRPRQCLLSVGKALGLFFNSQVRRKC